MEDHWVRAYVIATGAIFGLITLAHVWRVYEEGTRLLTQPGFILTTLLSAGLCLWAWRSARTLKQTPIQRD